MNESYWQKTSQHPCFKQLNKDIKTDILIIGGGLSGISCAYQLKETGKKITVVEKNLLGREKPGRRKTGPPQAPAKPPDHPKASLRHQM